KRIISYHNLNETPENLEDLYAEMLKLDGDVYKIAVMAQAPADVARVLRLQKAAPKPTVAFCMGDVGSPSRYLALKYGAPWIYAAFNKERGIAPGLPSLEEFRTTYPVRSIDADTRVFGVAGDRVGTSLSPVLHNHIYRRMKLNAVYLGFGVPRGQFPQAVEEYAQIPVEGYSVTIPHKEAAAALAREKDPTVELTGAANTLVRRSDGQFIAANTDYSAILDSLKEHMRAKAGDGPVTQLNQCAVLVLGAGGAARAVCHALHKEGSHITIAARTPERAHALAEEVNCKTLDWHARHSIFFDILVNCTPVGMHPNVDEAPVHVSVLKPGVTVFDTVYNPETTLLIREAKARGCDTITGVDMFVRQAARQVELFTGQTPDLELMRGIVRKALSPLTRALDAEDGEQPAEPDDSKPTEPEGDKPDVPAAD
ncbi:MAG TPA: shikimate dehydrogenase, partial [Urbifossiella sp.]|nr:shikimate dehydrogenase [Urbifossiella sp.]